MNKEDIDFLISIQDLEQPDFDNACLERENKRLNSEIDRLNNIIKNLDKMFEYYFLGNLKYDQDTVNTIYIKYIKLKELKEDNKQFDK